MAAKGSCVHSSIRNCLGVKTVRRWCFEECLIGLYSFVACAILRETGEINLVNALTRSKVELTASCCWWVDIDNIYKVTGEWRRLHNEELYPLYSSPNIIRVIKSVRLRWAGHVALWRRGGVHTGFWWGNLGEWDHLEDRGVDGRIILKWILEKWDGAVECIDLAEDRDMWGVFVNAVMNLLVS